MNIFVLDSDPIKAARAHANKHVYKMIIESAQMLSVSHYLNDGTQTLQTTPTGKQKVVWQHPLQDKLYKPSHVHHPCVQWVCASKAHYKWLYNLFAALCDEYTYRYGRIHLTDIKMREFLKTPPQCFISQDLQGFVLCIPDQYHSTNAVASYREYYTKEKSHLHQWGKRGKPEWISLN